MKNFGKAVVKSRFAILAVALLLLIPSVLGYLGTRINYDLLTYLPKDIETIKGQDILVDEFGTGAVSMVVVEGMPNKDVAALKKQIEGVEHVENVIWYDSFMDLSIPVEVLPEDLKDAFMKEDATMMCVTFDTSTSADETMEAIEDVRALADKQVFVSGMSAVVTDTKNLAEKEEPVYVVIAVALAIVVLAITMDTFLAPLLFLLSIGMAIIYNLGSNVFMGQISYITKALAAVLQLGVTMDYSIFLWHSYQEQIPLRSDRKQAMAQAINMTLQSVIGSSVTTIAGFAALCFMSFSLGYDIGIVMMKGVLLGVISCVTILPSLILCFDKLIEKTRHKPLVPTFNKLSDVVVKHYKVLLVVFIAVWIPAIFGYTHTEQYYDLTRTLPGSLPSIQANAELADKFEMSNTMMILADRDLKSKDVAAMAREMKKVDGVKSVLGLHSAVGAGIPDRFFEGGIADELTSDDYQLLILTSEYETATDEINAQIDELNGILKTYDEGGMLIGEAPCTKDLIRISAHDFNVVNWASIGIIFCIIFLVFKSISLPALLVLVIEFAIFINMSLPYFTGTTLPFIASIVIGTIQLGSTVDYAILMTSRYQTERHSGKDKMDAVMTAHRHSVSSIFVSALTFFAATFGVGMYSNIEMISALCMLMARGAIISMAVVMTMLPAILILFDPVILRTSKGFAPDSFRNRKSKKGGNENEKKTGHEPALVHSINQ